ncbi:MAG: YitT family protein, partial [Atopobium sp.]|nr:YitT family protein [Atopobium sp.]
VAQLIRSILVDYCDFQSPFDIAGIINALLNIPLSIIAFKKLSHSFFVGTLLSVIVQMLTFSIVVIPTTPLISDIAIDCVVGAALAAIGIGLTLMAGYSGGGTDILGVYLSQKSSDFSVGKLTLLVNCFVYFTSAGLFGLQTAIYSIFYAMVFSFVLDRLHFQNREICCIIFTRNPAVRPLIVSELHRGLTWWNGMGGWSDVPIEVLISIVSKKELPELSRKVRGADPAAFIIRIEETNVVGNFEKRLIA